MIEAGTGSIDVWGGGGNKGENPLLTTETPAAVEVV